MLLETTHAPQGTQMTNRAPGFQCILQSSNFVMIGFSILYKEYDFEKNTRRIWCFSQLQSNLDVKRLSRVFGSSSDNQHLLISKPFYGLALSSKTRKAY
jgi:hypothetical protein